MSPEQLLAEPLDLRSDVFALALLAFAMLTGSRAFTGGTRQAEMMAPLSSSPRTLRAIVPGQEWPDPLQTLFNRTLSRDANDRPATALEFANELARIVNAPRTGATQAITVTLPRRNNKLVFGGAAIAAVALVGVYFAINSNDSATPATTPSTTLSDTLPATPQLPVTPAVAANDTNKAANTAAANSAASNSAATNTAANAGTNTGRATPTPPRPTRPPLRDTTPVSAAAESGMSAADAAARARLRQLMNDADASLGTRLSADVEASRAHQLLRDIDALTLTIPLDQGWAWLYQGMAHATLKDKAQACAAFQRAEKLSGTSVALSQSVEQWQLTLICPP
jgi:hypothetical protein